MANRAYLVTLDRPETDRPTWSEEDCYFDSRWTIPLAWLFFFQPEDMVIVEEDCYGPSLRLVAKRQAACAYFVQRRNLIEEMVGDRSTRPLLDFLYQSVSKWPKGTYLVLDPAEIWECGAEDIPVFRPLLDAIADPQATTDSIRNVIATTEHSCIVTDFSDSEHFHVHLIGYTYW